jgi:hypothetical protein
MSACCVCGGPGCKKFRLDETREGKLKQAWELGAKSVFRHKPEIFISIHTKCLHLALYWLQERLRKDNA